jgi:glycerophosphoryl diester phosphodiesterase
LNWLTARPIAHRGWHGDGRIENSLSAARAAVAAGFAIECDVQRSADGEAIVFHDDSLERLTQAQGRIADYSATRLAALRLGRSADPIPTLTQLLELIAGRVPLICEIKSGFEGDMRLAARAAEIVAGYDGPLAFKSFDPDVVGFLRESGSARPLGLVAEASYDDPYFAALSSKQKRDCAAFLHVARTRPDFLSWRVDDLPHAAPSLFRALGGKPVMAWTVRTSAQWALVREFADQAVFEGRPPENPES